MLLWLSVLVADSEETVSPVQVLTRGGGES